MKLQQNQLISIPITIPINLYSIPIKFYYKSVQLNYSNSIENTK